ncbi:adenine phosphoribosyltransferase [Entomoplasma freundtii]|uniref:adenine phosphoribosyltransferase n=1 Tax=Entomoplasma freundtii TaxID=74700 RepID=UPI000C28B0EE
MKIQDYITEVPDFPKQGISFKDITPILNNPPVFHQVVDEMARFTKSTGANIIVAPEARGFIFAAPVAYATNIALVLIRKAGKLPRATIKKEYDLEYGKATLEMHKGDIKPGDKVVIIDDVLATGGTLEAIIEMVEAQGAKVVGLSVLADLTFLHDDKIIANRQYQSLVNY